MTGDLLLDNLAAIERAGGVVPDLGASGGRGWLAREADGSPRLLTADGRRVRLESARSAPREAEAVVEGAVGPEVTGVAILGAGTGAVIDVLARRPGLAILVLEPDAELAALWLSARSWVDLISGGRLRVLVGPAYAGTSEAARLLEGRLARLPVIAHPVLLREYPEAMAEARRALDRVVRDAHANAGARAAFEDLALVHTLRNLRAVADEADAGALAGRYAGRPAVVIGAGPSLDAAIPALRQLQDRALLVAADTALLPCLRGGLVPAVAVALDPSETNGRHLRACASAADTYLVGEAAVAPDAMDAFAGRTFVFRAGDHAPWPWLGRHGGGRTQLEVWGSAITAALTVALEAGCTSIGFAGLDLAYTGGRPYCRGTVFEEDWAWEVAGGMTLDDYWATLLRARVLVDEVDLRGEPAVTAGHLVAFRDWLREATVRHPAVRFANTTPTGILHGGRIEPRTIEALAGEWPVLGTAALLAPVREAYRASAPAGRRRVLADALRRSDAAAIAEGHSAAARAARACLEPSAMAEFVARLETATPVTRSPVAPPPAAPGGAVLYLPEQVALLAGLVRGDPPAGSRQVDAARHLLRRALRHLRDIVAAGPTAPARIAPADVLSRWHVAPAAWLFDWPSAVRPAVEAFADLLARAIAAGGAAPLAPLVLPPRTADDPGEWITVPGTSRVYPAEVPATAALVWQWTLAWALVSGDDPQLARAVQRLVARPTSLLPAPRPDASLRLWLCPPGEAGADLPEPLPFFPELTAMHGVVGLVASGDARGDGGDRGRARCDEEPPRVRIAAAPRAARGGGRPCAGRWLEVDALRERGLPLALRLAAISEDAVLLTGEGEPLVVTRDGHAAGSDRWPHPMRAALDLGDRGRLAWSWDGEPSLMFRDARGRVELLEIGALPFDAHARPDGSVILATDAGLWSWQPGSAPRPLAPGPPLVAVYAHQDGVRCCRRSVPAGAGWEAAVAVHAWRPGEARLREEAVVPGEAAYAMAACGGWQAEAWMDASLLHLRHADGRRLSVACNGPRSLAWAGRTLFVATLAGDVYRFPEMADQLDAIGAP